MAGQTFDSVADGLIITDSPALSSASLQAAILQFVLREESYRCNFLQERFEYGFDGYSYPGQVDSTHQSPQDQLHSFVFSDFHAVDRYPDELLDFMSDEWRPLVRDIAALERTLLDEASGTIRELHSARIGHMLSANYYPPTNTIADIDNKNIRLSEHPDVSLLTLFPFGLDEAFEYQDKQGHWQQLPRTDRIIAFPGYLYEWLSGGEVTALNHRVSRKVADSAAGQAARYSFAVFSLPVPGTSLRRPFSSGGDTLSTEAYFSDYLSLWDY